MERNRLYIALGVLALLAVAVVYVYRKPADEGAERLRNPWGTIARDQVSRIVVQRPGDSPAVELEKREGHWVMTAPAQGPADEQAVSDALEGLTEMQVEAVAARETSSHDDLEVDRAHGIHVQLFRGNARVLDAWVGRNLEGGSAVRAEGNATVYRVNRSVRFALSKEVREWRDRTLTHLTRDHVRWVEWRNARGTWRFDRNGETWTAAASNTPLERLDTARVNQAVSNLLELRASDFAAQGANHGITDASPRVTINVDNGEPITLTVGSAAGDGEVYVRRNNSDIIYTISRTHGSEIDVEPSVFQAPPPPADAGASADASAADSGQGDAAAPSVPPEVMQQIRQQLQQRGIQMGGGH